MLGFNEAVALQRRKLSRLTLGSPPSARFNEAVALQRRKQLACLRCGGALFSFNEAVALQRRKRRRSIWSGRRSVASMRPSLFSDGNVFCYDNAGVPTLASMRPSLFSDGNTAAYAPTVTATRFNEAVALQRRKL